jgi:hypothetical protein
MLVAQQRRLGALFRSASTTHPLTPNSDTIFSTVSPPSLRSSFSRFVLNLVSCGTLRQSHGHCELPFALLNAKPTITSI